MFVTILPTSIFTDLKLGAFSVANCDPAVFEYCNAFNDNGWIVWKLAATASLAANTALNAYIEFNFLPVATPTRSNTDFYSYVWKN